MAKSGFILFCIAAALGQAFSQTLDVQKALRDRYLDPVKRLFITGEYERAANAANAISSDGDSSADYQRILVKAFTAVGHGDDALEAVEQALVTHPQDLNLLMLRYDTLKWFGKRSELQPALEALNAAAKATPASKRTASDLVALGRAALAIGADPQMVISTFLNPAKKKDPKSAEAYLALGELALEKGDYQRASKELAEGLKEHGEDPDLRAGLARAFAPSDRAVSQQHIKRALEINPRHVPSLLVQAEHQISSEKFGEAELTLAAIVEIDQGHPGAWALKSVVAILGDNDPFSANNHRTKALDRWTQNPEVDHIIGKGLSRAYRFSEGAQYQREALALDPGYMKAKVQLAQDLMRLGDTEEAWKLAAEIREADAYNTQAHNLGLLEREMSGYHVQRETDFVLRMPLKDWQVYGARALELLREARSVLPNKYGLNLALSKPTLVEFFPSQQDFAIRTFGSLGGQGLLGVCFGTVITMNSPGSLAAGRNNWEATLWHEYCHVVTLGATHNRMPRWLSEGISVYEEGRRDPAWGMAMTADYRNRILDEKEPPVPMSMLSSAFMSPKDGEALMFAYFLSARAVTFLIEQHGPERFQALLQDLASGTRINLALDKNIGPTDKLDVAFHASLVKAAKAYGAGADFEPPSKEELKGRSVADLNAYLRNHPNNVTALRRLISAQMEAKDWIGAAASADKLNQLEPDAAGAASGLWLKAKALNQMDKHDEELTLLRQVADRNADAAPIFERLMELETERSNWAELQKHASRSYALNPFIADATEALALATEAQGQTAAAIQHYERLLHLSPPNPTLIQFKLATLYKATDAKKAKRHLLDALAEAPRFKKALDLLLELNATP